MGHLTILEQLNNPLIAPMADSYGFEDGVLYLYQALLVCALTYEDNLVVLYDEAEYQKLANKFIRNLKNNMEADKNWNIIDKISMFKEYLQYYMEMPLYTEENNNVETASGTDWKNSMVVIFKKLGYTESEILNMSFKKLFYEWSSYAESEGAIKVMNSNDVRMLQELRNRKK